MKYNKKFKKKFLKLFLFLIVISIFFLENFTVIISQLLLYQAMPMYTSFLHNTHEDWFDQSNIINTHNVNLISTFDISQIQDDLIIDRYQNIIGINNIDEILQYEESFSTYVSAFNLNFSYEDVSQLRNVNTLLNRFFSLDRNTGIIDKYLDIDYFLSIDLNINRSSYPQVLIFHTHAASEFFIDSANTTDLNEGIVGVGATLTNILRRYYGLNVIHYRGVYDKIDGQIVRSGAYERIEPSIRNILEQNPTIELVIDLHRDGVPTTADPDNFRTFINGRPHAAIMFVNGLSAINDYYGVRRLTNIPNPYTRTNLALSFNLQMAFANYYPGLTRRLYLTPFRYINHLTPLSTLIEVGTQLSTKEEAHNSMEPLAHILYSVLFAQYS